MPDKISEDVLNQIKEMIFSMLKSNEDNYNHDFSDYEKGYADGVHDGYLDVLNGLGIDTDEDYRN